MHKHLNHSDSQGRRHPATAQEVNQVAEELPRFHRISWRDALGRFASAAFRLHHYRDVRTRMLYDALCQVDCTADPCESSDD